MSLVQLSLIFLYRVIDLSLILFCMYPGFPAPFVKDAMFCFLFSLFLFFSVCILVLFVRYQRTVVMCIIFEVSIFFP